MSKAVVVEGDQVAGTCVHKVTGTVPNPAKPPAPPTLDYTGAGTFPYSGMMSVSLSDFVFINGKSVAVVASQSRQTGVHTTQAALSWTPPPKGMPVTGALDEPPDGTGRPGPRAKAGSTFVTLGNSAVLLDGDSIQTCGNETTGSESSVKASGQNFVTCSE